MSSWASTKPILAFLCNWKPYRCLLDLGKSGIPLPRSIYPIKITCVGRVDPAMLLLAFERGAEGVMVIGCGDKDCRYGPGPDQAGKMAERFRGLMHVLGLEPERFSVFEFASHEKERLLEAMDAFAKKISNLENSPLSAQWRKVQGERLKV